MNTILITGASAGFGQAIAKRLVQDGHRIIACARRHDKLETLAKQLGNDQLFPYTLDITDTDAIARLPDALPNEWREIDILINNAGLALGIEPAQDCKPDEWLTMIDTNIRGLAMLTHQLLPTIIANQGMIINMGSIAGTYPYPGGNIYGASKAFVRQFSLNLRADLVGSGVRVSNIEPGLVGGSEFSHVRFRGDDARADALYHNAHALMPEDIAETVSWIIQQPAHVNINSIELMPTSQSFSALHVERSID